MDYEESSDVEILPSIDESEPSTNPESEKEEVEEVEFKLFNEDGSFSEAWLISNGIVKDEPQEPNLEGILDGSIPGCYTMIQCRSLYIGSYKIVPRDRVNISSVGIRISLPPRDDEDQKEIVLYIDIKQIDKVSIYFGPDTPALFIHALPSAAESVRAALKMSENDEVYYDPTSKDVKLHYITLLPEFLHVQAENALRTIFSEGDILNELTRRRKLALMFQALPNVDVNENEGFVKALHSTYTEMDLTEEYIIKQDTIEELTLVSEEEDVIWESDDPTVSNCDFDGDTSFSDMPCLSPQEPIARVSVFIIRIYRPKPCLGDDLC